MRCQTRVAACLLAVSLPECNFLTSVCEVDIEDSDCQLWFSPHKDSINKLQDRSILVDVFARTDPFPLTAGLLQDGRLYSLIVNAGVDSTYILGSPSSDGFRFLRSGSAALALQDGNRFAKPCQLRVIQSLMYPPPSVFISPTVVKAQRPVLEFMGIGKDIFGLVSGTNGTTDARSVRRYVFGPSGLAESTTYDFFILPVSSSALISVTGKSIYLSKNPEGTPDTVLKCSTSNSPVQQRDCTQLGYSLPPKTKTMLVTPDENHMLLADDVGNISACALPMEKPPCPTMVATGAGVLMLLADLSNDNKVDLVAAWQASGQLKVGVFLAAATGGFAKVADAALSAQLSAALGTSPIDAVAAGDIDGDGFDGDLVFGRGLKLTVLQSHQGRFEAVWSTDLDAAKAGPRIKAIAVGRLDASSTPDKPMDILVSSNTPYNAMSQSTLFIHIFRPSDSSTEIGPASSGNTLRGSTGLH